MPGRLIVLALVLLSTAGVLARVAEPEYVVRSPLLDALPMAIGPWVGARAPDFEPAVRKALGVDRYINRVYAAGEDSVNLYVGYYETQRSGRTMHSPLNCLPGSGWSPVRHERVQVAGSTVNGYEVVKGLDRLIVLYWYQAHGRVTASEYAAKFYLVRDALLLNRTDGTMVRIVGAVGEDETVVHAERRVMAFAGALFPLLERYLPA